jgi:hypothetical protein
MLERAEAAEREASLELDRTIVKSVIYVSGDRDPRVPITRPDNGKLVMMGQDPRLPRMPERPTRGGRRRHRVSLRSESGRTA